MIYSPLVLLYYLLILFSIFIGTRWMFHFCSNSNIYRLKQHLFQLINKGNKREYKDCLFKEAKVGLFYNWNVSGTRGVFEEIIYWMDFALIVDIWRRERDSNPRRPCSLNGFQVRRFQPLTHPSVTGYSL